MRSKLVMLTPLIIFLICLIALDFYVYKGLVQLIKSFSPEKKILIKWGYWSISIAVLLTASLTTLSRIYYGTEPLYPKYWVATIWIAFLTPKLFFAVFHLVEDIIQFFGWSYQKINAPGKPISRIKFLSQIGFGVFGFTLISNFFGIFIGKFSYKIRRETLSFSNLPAAFDGYKIVQFSDLHIGSFNGNHKPLERAFEMMNSLNPDVILFTGDMVNNIAKELDGWDEVIKKLKAKDGLFSVLGNHDYGYYYYSEEQRDERIANFNRLKERQKELGFDLILNDSRKINRMGESIDLLGVENWSQHGGKHGDLKAALKNADAPFKILMSHDPSHWKYEVKEKTNIDLTLSGHTHGLQYGIEGWGIKFSPVRLAYETWAGLYNLANQYIYVNRGLGFIFFLGRVGIKPEITEITLKRKAS